MLTRSNNEPTEWNSCCIVTLDDNFLHTAYGWNFQQDQGRDAHGDRLDRRGAGAGGEAMIGKLIGKALAIPLRVIDEEKEKEIQK